MPYMLDKTGTSSQNKFSKTPQLLQASGSGIFVWINEYFFDIGHKFEAVTTQRRRTLTQGVDYDLFGLLPGLRGANGAKVYAGAFIRRNLSVNETLQVEAQAVGGNSTPPISVLQLYRSNPNSINIGCVVKMTNVAADFNDLQNSVALKAVFLTADDPLIKLDTSLVKQAAVVAAVVATQVDTSVPTATVGTGAGSVTQPLVVADKGAPGGVATLDANRELVANQLPAIAEIEWLGDVSSEAQMLQLTGQRGDWCTRTDTTPPRKFVLISDNPTQLSSWRYDPAIDSLQQQINAASGKAVQVTQSTVITPTNQAAFNGKTLFVGNGVVITVSAGLVADFGFAYITPAGGAFILRPGNSQVRFDGNSADVTIARSATKAGSLVQTPTSVNEFILV